MHPYRAARDKTNGRDKARPYYQSANSFPITVGGTFMHPNRAPRDKMMRAR